VVLAIGSITNHDAWSLPIFSDQPLHFSPRQAKIVSNFKRRLVTANDSDGFDMFICNNLVMAFPYLEWKTVPVNLLKSRSEGKFGTVSRPADTTNLSHLNAPTPTSGLFVGRVMILNGPSSDTLSIPTTQALKRHLFSTVRSLFFGP
jgi:hypothetical protein